MNGVLDALVASGQNVIEGELGDLIMDRIRLEFDPTIIHITLRLDEASGGITIEETKFVLPKYQHRLSKHYTYIFNIH